MANAAGQALRAEKAREAERAVRPAGPGERNREGRVARRSPIEEQANVSSDGVMIRVRGEGWKEVKAAAISRVEVSAPRGKWPGERPQRRDFDPQVKLDQHSYVAGLWDADEFGRYQYAEGLRRGLDRVETLTSVNDGAPWIGRVTKTNWPKAIQILDWPHAASHVYDTAEAVWGEDSPAGRQWAGARLDELWSGRVEVVLWEMSKLKAEGSDWPGGGANPREYFEDNAERMRYDLFREAGYPIGSGTVESGAKNVIQSRMRRPGRGWRRENANGVLALLTEYHSGRFDEAWRLSRKNPA